MPRSVIGLDIGTFAVRAAEVSGGHSKPTLVRFGQVALPPGAVSGGEVVDPQMVGQALRRLWDEVGFSSRNVVIGLANQRVVVRQAELPEMNEEELRTALRFEADELIPMPIDDAILDFQVLDHFTNQDGDERQKILLVAAHRDTVRAHLAALEVANLHATAIDIVPFALVRALTAGRGETAGCEALVAIGSGVTNIVVHEGGAPRFVRLLMAGGDDLTEAVAHNMDVSSEVAEDLKRRVNAGAVAGDTVAVKADKVVVDRLNPLLSEIRGSIDYYSGLPDAVRIERVVVTGGGSEMTGLVERLEHLVRIDVERGDPAELVRVGNLPLTPEQLRQARPYLAVPLGLALLDPPGTSSRRISLLPEDIAEGREQRRQLVWVGVGLGAFAIILGSLWLGRGATLHAQAQRAEQAEAASQVLQQELATLAPVAAEEAELKQRQQTVDQVLDGDVAWTRLIQQVAAVVPEDVYLTGFNAQRGTAANPGTVTFMGTGRDQTSSARWLQRLGALDIFTNPWLNSSTKGAGPTPVQFQSVATLTDAADSHRAQRYTEGAS